MALPTDPCRAFLLGYPDSVLGQVRQQLASGQLGSCLARRYPEPHSLRTDSALYAHAAALKIRYLKHAAPLAKVLYDNRLQIDQRALGTLTSASRVQGGKLTAKRELRVAAVFKSAPADMLQMILVHELAHLKEREHDKPFYALCEHMLPGYHQIEFDTRLYLTWRAAGGAAALGAVPGAAPPSATGQTPA